MSSRELARVAALRAIFARPDAAAAGVRVGIGDDAAVLDVLGAASGAGGSGSLVWTVDAQVDGTHFRPAWVSWEDIGWRSFMAAASDLAAMGAEPVAALSSLVLAPSVDDEALASLARGQAAAAETLGASVVGGNLARGTETSITTTLLGRAARPVLRDGARAGDGVWLAGPVGLAAVGLALLERSVQSANISAAAASCLDAWRRPLARIAQGRALPGVAHSAIDVSDGLAHDAWQLAVASGVSLVLDVDAVLAVSGEALVAGAAAAGGGRAPIDFALHGGEDYALLATSAVSLAGFTRIGSVEAASDGGARLFTRDARGTHPVEPRGFDHFGSPGT